VDLFRKIGHALDSVVLSTRSLLIHVLLPFLHGKFLVSEYNGVSENGFVFIEVHEGLFGEQAVSAVWIALPALRGGVAILNVPADLLERHRVVGRHLGELVGGIAALLVLVHAFDRQGAHHTFGTRVLGVSHAPTAFVLNHQRFLLLVVLVVRVFVVVALAVDVLHRVLHDEPLESALGVSPVFAHVVFEPLDYRFGAAAFYLKLRHLRAPLTTICHSHFVFL